MYFYISIFVIFLFTKFINYLYKVLTIDVSEAINILNGNEKFVVVGYGHTSFLDGPYYISAGIKIGNIKCLCNKKHKWMFPSFTRKYTHFIESKTSQIKLDTNMVVLCEGTRKKKNKLNTGFYYLAQNNNYKIVYFVIDFTKNKIKMSKINHSSIKLEESLEPLKILVRDIGKKVICYYPQSLSSINF